MGENNMDTFEAFGDICSDLKREAPKRFLVIRFGKNNYTIGGETGEFDFTPESAQKIIDERSGREAYLMMDYDHGTLDAQASSQGNCPASGWVESLEVGEDGLYANVKNWTDKARKYLENGEYRHTSPVIIFDKKTNEPRAIQSIAITNHPALHSNVALVAANDTIKQKEESLMDETINEFKSAIKDLDTELSNLTSLRASALNDLTEYANSSENEEVKKDVQAFCDSFVSNVDIEKADEKITEEAKSMFSFSDLASALKLDDGVKDLNDVQSKFESMSKEVEELRASDNEKMVFLNTHNLESFSDLDAKIKSIEKHEKEFEEKLRDHKVEQMIEKALNDGKLMERHIPWAKKVALSDIINDTKFFEETIMKNEATVVKSFNREIEAKNNVEVLPANDAELQACKALSISVDQYREYKKQEQNRGK